MIYNSVEGIARDCQKVWCGPNEVDPPLITIRFDKLLYQLLDQYNPSHRLFPDGEASVGDTTLNDITTAMTDKIEEDNFVDIIQKTNQARQVVEHMADTGSLNIDAYLNKEKLVFEDPEFVRRPSYAIEMIIPVAVAWSQRILHWVELSHKISYTITSYARANKIPTRVWLTTASNFPETIKDKHRDRTFRILMLLKDYSDPIYPGMWSIFSNNKNANSLCCLIADRLVGTNLSCLGYAKHANPPQIFTDYFTHDVLGSTHVFVVDGGVENLPFFNSYEPPLIPLLVPNEGGGEENKLLVSNEARNILGANTVSIIEKILANHENGGEL